MSVEDTLAERGARYGDFTDHAAVCQRIKMAMIAGAARWTRLPDTHKQALEVIADKIARILTGDPNYADNWHDIQGYAKLVEDRLPKAPMTFHERVAEVDMNVQRAVEVCLTRGAATHTMSNPPGEDIYAEFVRREAAIRCEECNAVSRGGRTHVATCSQLTAPEEYKAEAQVAFEEAAAEPASAMDDDSARMRAIGQNGEMAEDVYAAVDAADPFAGAPDWAKYKAQDEDGEWFFYSHEPVNKDCGVWARQRIEGNDCEFHKADEPNPNWRDTLIART